MGNRIYKYELPVLKLEPYVEYIRKYFGFPFFKIILDIDLARDAESKGLDPSVYTATIYEVVKLEDVKSKLAVFEDDRLLTDRLSQFFWLTANLFHRVVYTNFQISLTEEYFGEQEVDKAIEKDIIRLYSFMRRHRGQQQIRISIGRDSVLLDDSFRWFQTLLDNKLFPLITGIDRLAQEVDEKKRAGRPSTRQDLNVFIAGISRFMREEQIIKEQAPLKLCQFIRWFLVHMDYIEEKDAKITDNWIKAQINNLQKTGRDYRFETYEFKNTVGLDALKDIPMEQPTLLNKLSETDK